MRYFPALLACALLMPGPLRAQEEEEEGQPQTEENEIAAPEPPAAPRRRAGAVLRPGTRPAPAPAAGSGGSAPAPGRITDDGSQSLGGQGQGLGTIEKPAERGGFGPMVPLQRPLSGGGGRGSSGANGLTRVGSFSSLPCWNNSGGQSAVQPVCAKTFIVIDKVGGGYAIPFRVEDPSIDFQLVEDVNGSQSCRYDLWFSKDPGGAVFVGGKIAQWCEQRGLHHVGGQLSATNCGLTKHQGQRFYINIRAVANQDPRPCAGHLSVWTNNAKGNTRSIMTQTPASLK